MTVIRMFYNAIEQEHAVLTGKYHSWKLVIIFESNYIDDG